jgi:hypothetical protein
VENVESESFVVAIALENDRELLIYRTATGYAFHAYQGSSRRGLLTATADGCDGLLHGSRSSLESISMCLLGLPSTRTVEVWASQVLFCTLKWDAMIDALRECEREHQARCGQTLSQPNEMHADGDPIRSEDDSETVSNLEHSPV